MTVNETISYFVFALILILDCTLADRNKFIRVDGINPTCYRRPECREYDISGAVISVDKSLPYMGSNYCCIIFNMITLTEFENDAYFMARLLNSTVLEGDDFITFYDESFKPIRNISANDNEPYKTIYISTPKIAVEIYKDRNYRSIYEILFSVYYQGSSPACNKEITHRCNGNTSICIDEELTCDKFPHCSSESDEELCGIGNETSMSYDKLTITIVLSLLVSLIGLIILLISLLCFCKSREKLTETFMSIFGYRSNSKNSRMLDINHIILNENEQTYRLINEKE